MKYVHIFFFYVTSTHIYKKNNEKNYKIIKIIFILFVYKKIKSEEMKKITHIYTHI